MSLYDEVDAEARADYYDQKFDDGDRAYEAWVDSQNNPEYTHCSNCGGEFDSEGWCPNYCMSDMAGLSFPENHVPGQIEILTYLRNHPLISEVDEEDIPF